MQWCTVQPRFNEPLYNEVLGITKDTHYLVSSFRGDLKDAMVYSATSI